jgi:spoIIIJ-associated protein
MLLAHMGCHEVKIELDESGERTVVSLQVPEEDSGMLIGRRGETIEALQRILSLTYRDELKEKRVLVKVNDYSDRRQDIVQRITSEALEEVRAGGRPVTLPYLSGEERRQVHTLLKDAGVKTLSAGIGRDRRLTVYPPGMEPEEEQAQEVA